MTAPDPTSPAPADQEPIEDGEKDVPQTGDGIAITTDDRADTFEPEETT